MRKGPKPNSNEWQNFMLDEYGTDRFSDIAGLDQNDVINRIQDVTANNRERYDRVMSGYIRDKQAWNMGATASDRI